MELHKAVYNCLLVPVVILILSGCSSSIRYIRSSHREGEQAQERDEREISGRESEDTLDRADIPSEDTLDTGEGISRRMELKREIDLYIGVPYRYGGTNRRGFDCSGFVWRIFTDLGYWDKERTSSYRMSKMGRRIRKSEGRPGDLVFFRRGVRVDHIGIYMGNGRFAHASTKKGICYSSLYKEYYKRRFHSIRRVLE